VRHVTKKDLKERYPFSKEALYRFTKEHPEVLESYKKLERKEQAISNQNLDDKFDVAAFCDAVSAALRAIGPGSSSATQFHNLMIGALEFIFYPHLIYPRKEAEINEGRKRIDITYTNAAREGFFFRLHTAREVASNLVMVECKNYSSDVANPELDQMIGRFSINRGKLAILIARACNDRVLFIKRCRDTAQAGQGFIIALFDEDIHQMLNAIKAHRVDKIDAQLEARFNELVR
jgi:hypothetical protein